MSASTSACVRRYFLNSAELNGTDTKILSNGSHNYCIIEFLLTFYIKIPINRSLTKLACDQYTRQNNCDETDVFSWNGSLTGFGSILFTGSSSEPYWKPLTSSNTFGRPEDNTSRLLIASYHVWIKELRDITKFSF